ncbi:bifunctional 2',3'-cyclic-nucleotide 2'-phosphodiesterase/3'-nucleotidase [Pseudalkalibacillus hwajinpoensis]|uniref:Bifunctional 2',3'-cyclic-nucleotide 2'-phosphodiesterase/3'-nucleotidase n=1 Tax=Guptibacillus hwajinpoensis TaxID=208199 RepID=A0A4U1ML31_9BACL|nr:bifunctional 2',3'-cyclic-nucleotide 2'-phosphodiesterase/3'-nucleotidase [Pseudalkalibacillus hwajinpoensis]TKD71335.1 bifunctional 2',3'-cyclic-nucleotide 2'-phosphodiesterase/3'-nucleotidase [Pseudalkalibacillus hwajinpoensis]
MLHNVKRKSLTATITLSLLATSFIAHADQAEAAGSDVNLRIMETTDLHTNIVNYDYYKDQLTDQFGLAKTATLINQARNEADNSLLFDNGDLLQGNPLGDYVAKINPLQKGEKHPAYKAMNLLNYDAGNIGNHEFNFGLDFLENSLAGANFPYINANVYVYVDDHDNDPTNDENYFTPYKIINKTVTDESGAKHELRVGVIGFVPPQVMQWDKANLEGHVIVKDIVETANKYVPEMKAQGADLIVAIPHSGFEKAAPKGNDENAVYYLSDVDGIDAILFGHAHKVFPGDSSFEGINGVDNNKGTINGVPSVEPGYWGDHLGVIDLTLTEENGNWTVSNSQSEARPIYDKATKKPLVEADMDIVNAVKEEHEGTINYVRTAVGKTTAPINSYFALVNDDPSIQIVTNAQKWYVENNIQGTEYEGIPVLSAGAPFKAGGRGGASYYTDIPAGDLAIKNVADLYVYPNTLKAVLLTGEQVKDWLEMSAGQFNQINKKNKEEQPLINPNFPSFNYDVIDGVTYKIDVTEPAKYDLSGNEVNADANRIKELKYNGKKVTNDMSFIVATNNYRATGGGHFPHLDGSNIVIDSPDENRQILIDYILEEQTINPTADQNWSFDTINKKKLNVTFESSLQGQSYAKDIKTIDFVKETENGFATYKMDLSKQKKGKKHHKGHHHGHQH